MIVTMPPTFSDLQLVGAIFAALLGLAFGSFLNVCLSRLPEGESIASPRSHCRNCDHTLAWWENLPLLSWLILRGRCRQCRTWIGLRYPLVELAVGLLWAGCWIRFSWPLFSVDPVDREIPHLFAHTWTVLVGYAFLSWMLIALAALDAEHFWLPDWLTLPGIALGFIFTLIETWSHWFFDKSVGVPGAARNSIFAILAAAAVVLFIRLAYWLIRRQEGMGLGDAKLMAMLGAWFGLSGALESFALAVLGATAAALIWLAILATRRKTQDWAKMLLPLGTFLCLTALSEIFYPDWLFAWWTRALLH
jgi:leader peptidase (prepilin peptidase) / N-methyltransferase